VDPAGRAGEHGRIHLAQAKKLPDTTEAGEI
jgi:hypothetical protein